MVTYYNYWCMLNNMYSIFYLFIDDLAGGPTDESLG